MVRSEKLFELGYIWFSAKSMLVEFFKSLNWVEHYNIMLSIIYKLQIHLNNLEKADVKR